MAGRGPVVVLPPPGSFHGANNTGEFDINRDFGFGNYSTFAGKIDYRFRRKHHLIFSVAPITNSKDLTLSRTIEFQGQTFDVGAQVSTLDRAFVQIEACSWAPSAKGLVGSLNLKPGFDSRSYQLT
jgi:hypothetical protein